MSDIPKRPKTTPTGFPKDRSKVVKVVVPTEAVIDRVKTWRVKTCYTVERQRWERLKTGDKVKYVPPRKYDGVKAITIEGTEVEPSKASVWWKIIVWCQARYIPPEEYVRVCFHGMPNGDCAPEPAQLLGPKYEAKWKKLWSKKEEMLRVSLQWQKDTAKTRIVVRQKLYKQEPEASFKHVLTDGNVDLSPLFRYCLAKSIGGPVMRKVAQTFKAEAILQFECYRKLYKKVWAAELPKGFSAMSKRVYPLVLAKLGLGMKSDKPSDSDE